MYLFQQQTRKCLKPHVCTRHRWLQTACLEPQSLQPLPKRVERSFWHYSPDAILESSFFGWLKIWSTNKAVDLHGPILYVDTDVAKDIVDLIYTKCKLKFHFQRTSEHLYSGGPSATGKRPAVEHRTTKQLYAAENGTVLLTKATFLPSGDQEGTLIVP